MSPLKAFKSTCSHPTHLLNTSLRHFSQETMEFQCVAVCSVWQGGTGSSSEKSSEESHAIQVTYGTIDSNIQEHDEQKVD